VVLALLLLTRACGGDAAAPPPRAANRVEITAPDATLPEREQTPEPADASVEAGPPPRQRKDVYALGDEAVVASYAMTVHVVQECVVPYYFKPKKGNVKLGVEVSIRAHASAVPVNPFYASLALAQLDQYIDWRRNPSRQPRIGSVRRAPWPSASPRKPHARSAQRTWLAPGRASVQRS